MNLDSPYQPKMAGLTWDATTTPPGLLLKARHIVYHYNTGRKPVRYKVVAANLLLVIRAILIFISVPKHKRIDFFTSTRMTLFGNDNSESLIGEIL